jgi:putative ABC transport system permease protein
MYAIKLANPQDAEAVKMYIDTNVEEVDISLSSEFVENIPDFQNMEAMIGQISFLALMIGTVGMVNTMLMSVLERTREIGVLRALGWKRRQVLLMILREALALGIVGGVAGIIMGFLLSWGITQIPFVGKMIQPSYQGSLFGQVVTIALVAGTIGGIYPAWRATRMRPVEALRYE